jgi:hypothetical protein
MKPAISFSLVAPGKVDGHAGPPPSTTAPTGSASLRTPAREAENREAKEGEALTWASLDLQSLRVRNAALTREALGLLGSGIPGSTDLLTLNLANSGGPTGILGGVSVGNLIGGSLADRMPLR